MKRPIWFTEYTLDTAGALIKDTMIDWLGIELTGIGDDFLQGRMPLDRRTCQPAGILHGGASLALAETLASLGASWVIDPSSHRCAGLEINANHLRPVTAGYVFGLARPLHLGTKTQVWEIRITDSDDRLACISRTTIAVLDLHEG